MRLLSSLPSMVVEEAEEAEGVEAEEAAVEAREVLCSLPERSKSDSFHHTSPCHLRPCTLL
jgi:hypothetical protein